MLALASLSVASGHHRRGTVPRPGSGRRPAVAVACRALALATSRFDCFVWLASALLKPFSPPPLPALGHLRNRKQSLDLLAITRVDAKYVPDGESMSRPLDYSDFVTHPYTALDD